MNFLCRNLVLVILKLTAQIMLCLKLEMENGTNSPTKLPLYYVMIPVWIILPVTVFDVSFNLYRQSQ